MPAVSSAEASKVNTDTETTAVLAGKSPVLNPTELCPRAGVQRAFTGDGFTSPTTALQQSSLSTSSRVMVKNQLGNKTCGHHTQAHLGPETLAPCSGQCPAWEVQPSMTANPLFLRTEWSHHSCFFSSSEYFPEKCVLSVAGESPTCPTNPLAINVGGHCCACTVPHLCTDVCSPTAESHSLLGSLPLATACKLGRWK